MLDWKTNPQSSSKNEDFLFFLIRISEVDEKNNLLLSLLHRRTSSDENVGSRHLIYLKVNEWRTIKI